MSSIMSTNITSWASSFHDNMTAAAMNATNDAGDPSHIDDLSAHNATGASSSSTSASLIANPTFQVMLCVAAVLVMMYLVQPNVPDERYRLHLWRAPQQAAQDDDEEDETLDERQERIHRSLTMQRVLGTDEDGFLLLGDTHDDLLQSLGDATRKMEVTDDDDDDDDESVCMICLEPFQIGDEVAWSKHLVVDDDDDSNEDANDENPIEHSGSFEACMVNNSNENDPTNTADEIENKVDGGDDATTTDQFVPCRHVFHAECILSWVHLPKHNDCPSCRTRILERRRKKRCNDDGEADIAEVESTTTTDIEMGAAAPFSQALKKDAPNPNTTPAHHAAYVIIHGLVSTVRKVTGQYAAVAPHSPSELYSHTTAAADPRQHRPSISLLPLPLSAATSSFRGKSWGGRRSPPPIQCGPRTAGPPLSKMRRVQSIGPGTPTRTTSMEFWTLDQSQYDHDASLWQPAMAFKKAAAARPGHKAKASPAPRHVPLRRVNSGGPGTPTRPKYDASTTTSANNADYDDTLWLPAMTDDDHNKPRRPSLRRTNSGRHHHRQHDWHRPVPLQRTMSLQKAAHGSVTSEHSEDTLHWRESAASSLAGYHPASALLVRHHMLDLSMSSPDVSRSDDMSEEDHLALRDVV